MPTPIRILTSAALAVAMAAMCFRGLPAKAQAPAAAGRPYTGPRTPDGKPNLNGIWQAMSTAHWNLEAHSAAEGVPAGVSVVEGETIPYQPAALAQKKENQAKSASLDPINKCFLPGVPRITYIPFPFQIAQTPKYVGDDLRIPARDPDHLHGWKQARAAERLLDGRFARALGGRHAGR